MSEIIAQAEALHPVEDALRVETECLKLTLRRTRLHLRQLQRRREAFWSQPERVLRDEDLRLAAQQQIWTQHRAVREHGCLQPLSTCVAELRRWQGVQRAAHERKCAQLRCRREASEGDLQWRIFCARLAHDSCGALSVAPLTPEQTRFCDAAAAPQLQPRSKAKDAARVFTVMRAASISAARPSGYGAAGPASARSTRGLVCGDLCQSSSQLERTLSRLIATALAAAETSATSLSASAPASAPAAAPTSASTKGGKDGGKSGKEGKGSGSSNRATKESKGESKGEGKDTSAQGRSDRAAVASAAAAAADAAAADGASSATALPGKRLPLFPMAMRLSSECLGWLRGPTHEGPSTSDRHLYYLVEEIDGAGGARYAHRGGGPPVTRAFAEALAATPDVRANIDVGVDLCLVVPETLAESAHAPRKQLHLRPAAVEHLLAVDCLWPGLDAADRQMLSTVYTPRQARAARAPPAGF